MNKLKVVGLGPGPADLVTVKASRVLAEADSVFMLARPTVWMAERARELAPKARLELYYPQSVKWTEMEGDPVHAATVRSMHQALREGANVAWACAGDPSFFSPFAYLQPHLQDLGIEWEMVPGVGFVNAIGAVANQPLSMERESLLVTKLRSTDACKAYFEVADSLVLFDPKPEEVAAVCAYAREAALQHVSFTQIKPDFSQSLSIDLLKEPFPGGVGLLLVRRERI